MKIVADNKIPFLRGVFEPHAEILYLPGGEITRDHLIDADCLLVRTRTHCDRHLLEGTSVRFIGTATIGFDHIDTVWCEQNGITWTNAPGCNSGGVAQYVTAALHVLAFEKGFDLRDKTLGIVGVGHVGKKVEKIASVLGMKVLLHDPPRQRDEGGSRFTDLTTLLRNSDIVTIHVPLNREGTDKTWHMVDTEFLRTLKPGAIVINSSRGDVVYENELIKWINQPDVSLDPALTKVGVTPDLSLVSSNLSLVFDVWENEPQINDELLRFASIATPHIAGYSTDGKLNATRMIVEAVSKEFRINEVKFTAELKDLSIYLNNNDLDNITLNNWITASYDIMADDRRLRLSPGTFEEQRNSYPVRRDFSACRISPFPEGETGRILEGIGFKRIK